MFKIFLLILLAINLITCTITWNNCDDEQVLTVVSVDYEPADSFIVGTEFSYTLLYKNTETITTASSCEVKAWINDFHGDPLITETFSICDFLDCPIPIETHTRTDHGIIIPEGILGEIKVTVSCDQGSLDFGCFEMDATVSNSTGPTPTPTPGPNPDCEWKSYIDWAIEVNNVANFENEQVVDRKVGDWIQVGDLGDYDDNSRGGFSKLEGSSDNDFGIEVTASEYQWAFDGKITVIDSSYDDYSVITYKVNFWVGSATNYMDSLEDFYMKGEATFSGRWSKTSNEMLTMDEGELVFDPKSNVPPRFSGPIIYGKLNPIGLEYDYDTKIVTIQKDEILCQCRVDVCGECNGDNSTCAVTPSPEASPSTEAKDNDALVLGLSIGLPIGFLCILILVIILVRQSRSKNKKQKEIIASDRFAQATTNWEQITEDNVKSSFSKSQSTQVDQDSDEDDDDEEFSFDNSDSNLSALDDTSD
ncbi:myelin p0 related [Anaeramoeba flamelloides]|uniref:Myelin p0 related n=1 Tax=Anaeramoeba flamelloides TaxID=1746091 RepID=A0AAV7Z5H0_9EUKA|nr:myelin p0 related [Anaeramoeba flamelloides]